MLTVQRHRKISPFAREARWAAWPSVWARERLGFEPDDNQEAFLDSTSLDEILLWARQIGKTECMGLRIGHTSIYRPGSLQLVVSASQRQAGILQKRVINTLRKLNMPPRTRVLLEIDLPEEPLDPDSKIVRCSVLSMEIGNGSAVISVPASPDTVRGYSPDDLYLDEAARIPDGVYEAIRPMRAAKPVRLVLGSTPKGKRGFFWEEWNGADPAWWRSKVTAAQCPRVTAEFLARERRTVPERVYQQEYECLFLEREGAVFPEWMIAAAFSKDVKPLFDKENRPHGEPLVSPDIPTLFGRKGESK